MHAHSHEMDRILILDDTEDLAVLIGQLAEQAGFKATVTTDIEQFTQELERRVPGTIVLDLQMPEMDGIEVLARLSTDGITSGILLVSGMDRRTIESAEKFGRNNGLNMLGSVQKPFAPEGLVQTLTRIRQSAQQLTGEDLVTAFDDSAMKLHFQPVVRRLGRGVWHAESVEALIRWEHPGLGLLTPSEFLPLAGSDRSALMQRLTDFVIQRGIEYLQVWQKNGLHLGLRVNVAGPLIADTSFPDRLERFMLENQIDPSLLTLEISDASVLANSNDGIEVLTRLRLKEVRIALSDFGSQDQSISALYVLPISEIKLDKKIAADLPREKGASILVRGFADIAANLGVALCIEGIESEEQLRIADALGCDLAQGFFISEPVPSSQVTRAVSGWTAKPARQVPSSAQA